MKAREFLESELAKWDAPRRKAIKLAQFGETTAKEIAQATGLKEKDVIDVIDQFNRQVEKELIRRVKAGLGYEEIDFRNVRLET